MRLLEQRNSFSDRSKQRGGDISAAAASCVGVRLSQQADADETVDGIELAALEQEAIHDLDHTVLDGGYHEAKHSKSSVRAARAACMGSPRKVFTRAWTDISARRGAREERADGVCGATDVNVSYAASILEHTDGRDGSLQIYLE